MEIPTLIRQKKPIKIFFESSFPQIRQMQNLRLQLVGKSTLKIQMELLGSMIRDNLDGLHIPNILMQNLSLQDENTPYCFQK
jgi:hypothetical protein